MFEVIKTEKEIDKRMLKVAVLKLNKHIINYDFSTCKEHNDYIMQL